MMKETQVSGIIVTYNPDINKFVSNLSSVIKQVHTLIVLDNNSSNANELNNIIKELDVVYIPMESNVGLSKAQNVGITYAKEINSSHVVIFDQDSLIQDDFISSLLTTEKELLSCNTNVGAVGPYYYEPDTGKLFPATAFSGPFMKKFFPDNNVVEVSYLIASGCLIRISVLENVGYFKDDFFIDYIDVEWSFRAKNKGYKLFMTQNAKMAHSVGDKRITIAGRTVSQHSSFRRYFLIRNFVFILKLKYIPVGYKTRELFLNVARFIINFGLSENKVECIRLSWQAVRDGFAGRLGPLDMKKKR